MNTDCAGDFRYVQLRKPAEHISDYIVCVRVLHNLHILNLLSRPDVVEKFRCEICSVRPFDSLTSEPVLYKLAFIEQLAENFTRQIGLQVAHPLFVVIKRQCQRIISKIIYIRNPQHNCAILMVLPSRSFRLLRLSPTATTIPLRAHRSTYLQGQ